MTVFQLTERHVAMSNALEPCDVGKWCYLVAGTHQGFFSTQAAAQRSFDAIYGIIALARDAQQTHDERVRL